MKKNKNNETIFIDQLRVNDIYLETLTDDSVTKPIPQHQNRTLIKEDGNANFKESTSIIFKNSQEQAHKDPKFEAASFQKIKQILACYEELYQQKNWIIKK